MANTPLTHFYGVCERTSDSFWAEPLNTLTSLGFLVSAVLIYNIYRNAPNLHHQSMRDCRLWDINLLKLLIFAIGLSSFMFHTMPSTTTELIDVISVVLFVNIYFIAALFRIAKCHWFQALISYIAFLGFTHMVVSRFPQAFNDSIGYLTTMASLTMFALYLNLTRRYAARSFLLAALFGVAALFFRSIDNAVCETIPFGTHFLWHFFNMMLVFVLMRQMIRTADKKARQRVHSHDHYSI